MGTPEYNRAPEIIKEHKRIHAVNNSIEAPPERPSRRQLDRFEATGLVPTPFLNRNQW